MAVNTETKRRSALAATLAFLVVAPLADGTVANVDREHIVGIYAGIEPGRLVSIETELEYLMVNDGSVSALVSTRVYPNILLQGAAMPAITYQQISGMRDEVMDSPTGLVESRFQFNYWSDTYSETREIAAAVEDLLDGYSGTVSGVKIEAIHLIDEGDIPQFPAGNDVSKRYGKRHDYTVWFKEIV